MRAIVAIALCAISVSASAEFWTGNVLFEHMESSDPERRAAALAYVAGVFDTGLHVLHCAPSTVTVGQAHDMVRKVLRESPSIRDKWADSIVSMSMRTVWPCRERRNTPPERML